MDIEDLLKYMLAFFQNIHKELQQAIEELSEKDKEQQDILHYIENHTLNAGGYAKVGKKLKDVRMERREVKYKIEELQRLEVFANKYKNKLIEGDIIQTLKDLSKMEKQQCNPTYTYRTDILRDILEAKA